MINILSAFASLYGRVEHIKSNGRTYICARGIPVYMLKGIKTYIHLGNGQYREERELNEKRLSELNATVTCRLFS